MATLSARGCRKLAQANRVSSEQGIEVKVRYALRSDGKVLRAIDVKQGDYWQRGGYSIAGKLRAEPHEYLAAFERFAVQRDLRLV